MVRRRLFERLLFILPAAIVTLVNAMMGLRQALMLFAALVVFALMLRSDIRRRWMKIFSAVALFISLVIFVGYSRLYSSNATEDIVTRVLLSLAQSEDSMELPTILHSVLTYVYLYTGNAPEALSIFTKGVDPNWIVFNHTNTLLYNLMSKVVFYPDFTDG